MSVSEESPPTDTPATTAAAGSPDVTSQVAAANTVAGEAAAAIDKAAQTAQEIAAGINSASSEPAPATPSETIPDLGSAEGSAEELPPEFDTGELRKLLSIEVPVIVQLGTREMTVAEVTRFAVGAIIEFEKSAEEELELLINNKVIGKGAAVKVGENFGIKISMIGPVKETIRKLGAA
jgi:flagellar motor switch protein FliN/FliY